VSCGCKLSFGKQVADLPNQLRPRFLSGLPKADVDAILSVAKHRQFRRSSVVLHEGDPAEGVFLLTSGHGRQFVTTNDGRKVLLYWLTAGQVFGGVAVYPDPLSCQHRGGGGQLCVDVGPSDDPGICGPLSSAVG